MYRIESDTFILEISPEIHEQDFAYPVNVYLGVKVSSYPNGSGQNRKFLKETPKRKRYHTGTDGGSAECIRKNGIPLGKRKQYAGHQSSC